MNNWMPKLHHLQYFRYSNVHKKFEWNFAMLEDEGEENKSHEYP